MRVVLISESRTNLKISEGWDFLLTDIEFMVTCSITVRFKRICACFEVFVEVAFSFQFASLTPETSPNTKKLKRARIESFWHFDTLGSQNPRSYGDIDFIV